MSDDEMRLSEIREAQAKLSECRWTETDMACVLRLLDARTKLITDLEFLFCPKLQARLAKAEQDRDTFEACDRERHEKLIDCEARAAAAERKLAARERIINAAVNWYSIPTGSRSYPTVDEQLEADTELTAAVENYLEDQAESAARATASGESE